jgi:hypothetical protein
MKKTIITSLIILVGLTSCNTDFLDQDNLFEKDLNSFYQTPQDIEEAMSGVFNALYVGGVHSNEHVTANLLSDMMLAGGGPDDVSAKNADAFIDPNVDTYRDLWGQNYKGIYRANAIIEAVENGDFSQHFDSPAEAEVFKTQTLGEAYFMRAFFFFRGAKFFGGLPLITATDTDRYLPRSTFSETFAQIASDLKKSIELFPATNQTAIPSSEYGHANKWVAEAYLGRVYLFYTGYMSNIEGQATSDLPLTDGGAISQSDAAGYLQDCVSNSGYQLVSF